MSIISVGLGAERLFLVVCYLSLGSLGHMESRSECDSLMKDTVGVWALNLLVCICEVHWQVNCLLSPGNG